MNRETLLANRRQWIAKLRSPKTKKAKKIMQRRNGAACCLGHGCVALGILRRWSHHSNAYLFGSTGEMMLAPPEFMAKVGLLTNRGESCDPSKPDCDHERMEWKDWSFPSLANFNDGTKAKPADIADYLESVIDGGEGTPFTPLTDYPET